MQCSNDEVMQMAVTITYNGNTIKTITTDSTVTLPTNGKVMATDIVVSGTDVYSTEITYNGDTVATGTGTFTKTLQCANKVMASDVEVDVVVETPVLIKPYVTFETDDGSEFTLGSDAADYGSMLGYVFGSDGTFEYSTDAVNWYSWSPTNTIQSNNGKIYLRGTGNTFLSVESMCFLSGTKITLADGSRKNIEDVTYNDRLKVWDFDIGDYSTASICWITKRNLKNYHYYKLTFSDGTVLKTTGMRSNHKVYNVDEHYFKGVNITEVGDRVFSENGIVTVVNKEVIEEEVLYYNLITSGTFDCFANGILTSDRYGNTYPIDSNMMFIKDGRIIRPYNQFEAVGISRYWYDNLRLGEQTESLEDTVKYIHRLESQMLEVN